MNWDRLPPSERDAAYDNNRAVANSAEQISRRNAAAAAFRQAHGAHLDVAYGPQPRQKFDLYPAENAAAPCLVFIHGGYWQRNTREDFAAFATGIKAHGWSVAMPGYSLAPDVSLTQIVTELDGALTWLAAHGPSRGIAGPIVVSGWSAGAHLAAMLLAHPSVAAGFAISGVYDLAPIRDTYLNEKLRLTEQEIATLSPLTLPPVNKHLALAYGTRELWPLVNDSRALHAHRAAAHCTGALIPIAGADHFTIIEQLQSAESTLVRHLLAVEFSGSR